MGKASIVRSANKEFYDLAAPIYEEADGRRADVPLWLENKIKSLTTEDKVSDKFLDLGAGSGWIAKIAIKYFKEVYAYDISLNILQRIQDNKIKKIVGEAEKIAFRDRTFDVVVCFSVLHHIHEFLPVFKEIYRVLKNGGIFYSDHDIESNFVKRFNFLIRIYRALSSPAKRYSKANPQLTKKLYDLTEFHSNGIDSEEIIKLLKGIGFSEVKIFYHWSGLHRITDLIFTRNRYSYSKGKAPLFSFVAIK